jgi:hypothetical protein
VPPMDAHSRDSPERVKRFFAKPLIFVIFDVTKRNLALL